MLELLGGQVLERGLWDRLAGMRAEKALIEQRVVQPLVHPEIAERHGVVAPRAIVLFGPPGTGKTSFAHAIASRVGWPFVELFPTRLAAEQDGIPSGLRRAFEDIDELDHALVFVDKVEEIAAARSGGAGNAVVNELLKLIPVFRQRDGRLFVFATNDLRGLDAALIRPGRFDYVIQVGPPDADARRAIWQRYLAAVPVAPDVDLDDVVAASENFPPAEIEHAAHATALRCFQRALERGADQSATTADILGAVRAIRPGVTREQVRAFEDDVREGARL